MEKLPTYRRLIVRRSKTGLGIFAAKTFLAHTKVFEVKGSYVTGFEDDDLPEGERNNLFRFNEELYIDPKGKIGDYLNHSCNPNSYVKKIDEKLFVVALERISKGKEIAIDYSTITASDDSWSMHCSCGSAKCRKTIKKFRTLPKPLKDAYIRKGMVPEYIIAI